MNDVSDVTDTPGVPDRSALDGVDVPIVLPHEVGQLGQAILDAVATVVVGNRAALELVLAGILAGPVFVPGLCQALIRGYTSSA